MRIPWPLSAPIYLGASGGAPHIVILDTSTGATSFVADFDPSLAPIFAAVAIPLAGDFNEDGMVDAADYVVWRDGLGTIYTQEHYNIWRANFGASLTAGSGAADPLLASVPEPTGVALLCYGVLALAIMKYARHSRTFARPGIIARPTRFQSTKDR